MRAYELTEMENTAEYNQQIIDLLTPFGVEVKLAGDFVSISRDSMMAIIKKDETGSYGDTLEFIRDNMPKKLYITWSGKTDDDYFLSVMKR